MNFIESQYDESLEAFGKDKLASLGYMTNFMYRNDPKKLVIQLARYKFVSRMVEGFDSVLEIGCGDGFASRIVQKNVGNLLLSDFDQKFVQQVKLRSLELNLGQRIIAHNFIVDKMPEKFDGIYALDVLEHIDQKNEDHFMVNILYSLKQNGVLIFGAPSLESQEYASKASKLGHVNCKSGQDFKQFFQRYFENVFIFSMNDEVIHTGFYPMSHYLIAICCNKK